jgi:MarR family transcriptional regulator, 2-MHQ and catechol-resistance regulon repressor
MTHRLVRAATLSPPAFLPRLDTTLVRSHSCYYQPMPTMTPPRSTATAGLQRDAEALHAAMADLVRVYQFRDRDHICCHDVSVTQCYALETLVDIGPQRLGELAARLFLDKSTTSRVIGTLVRKGYVQQQPDPSDGRATLLHATRAGRALCARINADLVVQQRQVLQDLEPAVRAGVVDVIRRLAAAADARVRSGVSVAPGTPRCAPDGTRACT